MLCYVMLVYNFMLESNPSADPCIYERRIVEGFHALVWASKPGCNVSVGPKLRPNVGHHDVVSFGGGSRLSTHRMYVHCVSFWIQVLKCPERKRKCPDVSSLNFCCQSSCLPSQHPHTQAQHPDNTNHITYLSEPIIRMVSRWRSKVKAAALISFGYVAKMMKLEVPPKSIAGNPMIEFNIFIVKCEMHPTFLICLDITS